MPAVPFTVSGDLDLGIRIAPYLVEVGQDVTIREGFVPTEIAYTTGAGAAFSANTSQFLLEVPNGIRFLVSDGTTITYNRGPASDREVALFLLGSAWGALCYQRDLLPLHASAVIHQGSVHAFTGPSGAGKSTLSAALADQGCHFFTDDVLIIDPASPGSGSTCYSGQKDLKLWQDSLDLTHAKKMSAVRDIEHFEKYFALPANSSRESKGQLASLSVLKNDSVRLAGNISKISQITGTRSIQELRNSIYRPRFADAIWGKKKLFQFLAQLIKNVQIQEFNRTKIKDNFDQSAANMKLWIEQPAKTRRDGNV